ncbi:MAG: ribosome biogenesis GTPase YlqF [Ruminococcus sp.]|nr:ribosome biogenesis GTPase YlqF [Ruminococcus sp.]
MAEETMRQIQWFPGHMTKTRRMIAANLSLVDAIVEILDARIPYSSRNPEMDRMTGTKPKLFLLNKADLADSSATAKWISAYQAQNVRVLAVDCHSGKGVKQFAPTVRDLLASLLRKRQAHGIEGIPIRLMVVGIPNVGKSSFINRMAKTKRTKVEDRPGVTRTKQWVKIGDDMELLDMPGVLWPKFDDQEVAQKLAFTGAINDNIMDLESLASLLIEQLAKDYPNALIERYRLTAGELETQGFEILEALGRHRGMLLSGGVVHMERAAIILLDEFRSGKLGKITLELPM